MKGTKKLLCFPNVLLMLSTTILFMVKAYRLAINFETQNKAYKKPFGNMDRMSKVETRKHDLSKIVLKSGYH